MKKPSGKSKKSQVYADEAKVNKIEEELFDSDIPEEVYSYEIGDDDGFSWDEENFQ